MSDDRVCESPNPARCPVCATGFTLTPGAGCPTCGRAFAPVPVLSHPSDFRVGRERFRLDGPGWFVGGLMLLCCTSTFAVAIGSSSIIPLVMLMVPALLRTSRLFPRTRTDSGFFLFTTFVASLGVTILMAVAAVAAGVSIFAATLHIGLGLTTFRTAIILGGVTHVVVFVALFIAFWPRYGTSSKYDPGED